MVSPAAAGMTGPPGMMQQQQQPPAAAGLTGAMPGPAGLPPAPQLSAGGARDSSSGGMAPLPGTAPLRAESWSLENQFGHKGAVKSISEAYDQTLPKIPDLPGKVSRAAAVEKSYYDPSVLPGKETRSCCGALIFLASFAAHAAPSSSVDCWRHCASNTDSAVGRKLRILELPLTWLCLLCPAMPRSPSTQRRLLLLPLGLPQCQTWTPPLLSERYPPASEVQQEQLHACCVRADDEVL